MKKALATLALLLVMPSAALAIPTLAFDTTPGGAGGSLTYDGAGGPAIGADIVFVNLASNGETPLNPNTTLDCVGCSLAFTTGANLVEGPELWTWAGGGSFVLTGTIPSIGINAPVALISGTFTGTANTPGLAGADPDGLFIGVGVDTKDPTLAAFFGLGPNFNFANTEIALDTFDSNPLTGSFEATPNQADIINTQEVEVPLPSTGLLVGLGLLLMGGVPALRRLLV
jgi:hypothetical protein